MMDNTVYIFADFLLGVIVTAFAFVSIIRLCYWSSFYPSCKDFDKLGEKKMSYKTWLKRKEKATPYAGEANCRKCQYGEWVRTSAFCTGKGRPVKIPYKAWDTDKTGYCPKYNPREVNE